MDLLSRNQVFGGWLEVSTRQAKEMSALSSSLSLRTSRAALKTLWNCGRLHKASR